MNTIHTDRHRHTKHRTQPETKPTLLNITLCIVTGGGGIMFSLALLCVLFAALLGVGFCVGRGQYKFDETNTVDLGSRSRSRSE